MAYSNGTLEEELKNQVARDYFPSYDCTEIKGRIDFCVHLKAPIGQSELFDQSLYWAEAKKGEANPYESLVQLILTIGRARTYNEYLPPPFLGAFDAHGIAFLPYSDIMEVFHKNDFNWNVAPSNHDTREFKELYTLVESTLKEKSLLFYYDRDGYALREFIKKNFYEGAKNVSKITIDRNNFTAVYQNWRQTVLPTIVGPWDMAAQKGIIDGDFYLADLLSRDNVTIKEKLAVLLNSSFYKVVGGISSEGWLLQQNFAFRDGMEAHTAFWAIYERPPEERFWAEIIDRRDLLVPQDVRERKGSFFTPQKWVTLSQQYIAKALGEDYQDDWTIWDCCAGTGNLLVGLKNKSRIWASTIDNSDVDVMYDRIENGANMAKGHVFQFDFLNDSFDKLPKGLHDIVCDSEKRKRLVVYINPPYAEAGNMRTITGTGEHKTGVAVNTSVYSKYLNEIGIAGRELFAQFLIRIYREISGCTIANFSKLKAFQSPNFVKFRDVFRPRLESVFLIPASTFDNVSGKFPIGFFIWNTAVTETFSEKSADVYGADGNLLPPKTIYCDDGSAQNINKWIISFKDEGGHHIGFMSNGRNDFQHNNIVYILNSKEQMPTPRGWWITDKNLIPMCIYYAVRHVIPATWINDRDQFLYPNDGWKTDKEFQTDCLAYTLFNTNIRAKYGTNHWTPFTETEADADDPFESHFMTDFIAGKVKTVTVDSDGGESAQGKLGVDGGGADESALIPHEPVAFTEAATAVMDAGREVWRYYHKCIRQALNGCLDTPPTAALGNPDIGGAQQPYSVNASLYDIREYFQGRDDKGRMNAASSDATYTALMARLRGALDALAEEIEGKVYEYGFLKR